ncbi:uncharacterized protein LOC115883665 [Sitophilus oryzae]|uniref:Uncharacterized protein LOC115883665 n=1 Tax=Sitophilus oryzae TaxID=7048 RepID=A0A6J2Y4I7_SITOR|nr:uncharacterized protein LOC115883665 [Sitophilus oryzae]
MILPLLLTSLVSLGYIPVVLSRIIPNVVDVDASDVENRLVYNDMYEYMANQELLDVRIHEYKTNEIDSESFVNSFKDEIEQSYVVVETKTTRSRRGKRNYKTYHTLCHFKICPMGKRRRVL